MFLLFNFIIIFFILQPIQMAPFSILELCNFLDQKSVPISESYYNADVKAGKFLLDHTSAFGILLEDTWRSVPDSGNHSATSGDLDHCLGNLLRKMTPHHHIHLKLRAFQHGNIDNSPEYLDEMQKLEYLLINGKELVQTFYMADRRKYSPDFCRQNIEAYLMYGNARVVNAAFALDPPEQWPIDILMRQGVDEKWVSGKLIVPDPEAGYGSRQKVYKVYRITHRGERMLDAFLSLGLVHGKIVSVALEFETGSLNNDEHQRIMADLVANIVRRSTESGSPISMVDIHM